MEQEVTAEMQTNETDIYNVSETKRNGRASVKYRNYMSFYSEIQTHIRGCQKMITKEWKIQHTAKWIHNKIKQWNNHITRVDIDRIVEFIRGKTYKDR